MAKIKTLKQGGEILYPRTSTKAVLDDSGSTVENLLSSTKSIAEANKTAISGSGTYDATKGTVQSRLTALESSSGAVEVDTTLSVSGKAADAKATGDKVQEVAQSVTTLNTSVTNMDTRVTALESAGGGGANIKSKTVQLIEWKAYGSSTDETSAMYTDISIEGELPENPIIWGQVGTLRGIVFDHSSRKLYGNLSFKRTGDSTIRAYYYLPAGETYVDGPDSLTVFWVV